MLIQVLNLDLSCLPSRSSVSSVINIVWILTFAWRLGREGYRRAKGAMSIKLGFYYFSLQIISFPSPYYFLWAFPKSYWSTINLNCVEFQARMNNTLKCEISCSFDIIKFEMFYSVPCETKKRLIILILFTIWHNEIFRKTFPKYYKPSDWSFECNTNLQFKYILNVFYAIKSVKLIEVNPKKSWTINLIRIYF